MKLKSPHQTSAKQIAANRRNSQKSTGPKSTDGKNKVRLNAKRDGMTGQVITLSNEDRPVFEKLKADLIADLAPKTIMEIRLANSIAWDLWRLDVLRAVEANTCAQGANNLNVIVRTNNDAPIDLQASMSAAVTWQDNADRFAANSLYEQRLNRIVHKNLATLNELQAERKIKFERDLSEEVLLAKASDINELAYQAPAAASQNGFVFSNDEIFSKVHRQGTLARARTIMLYNSGKVQYAGASASPALLDPFPPVNRSNESDNVTRINQKRVHNKPIYTSEVVQASDLESGAKSTFLSR